MRQPGLVLEPGHLVQLGLARLAVPSAVSPHCSAVGTQVRPTCSADEMVVVTSLMLDSFRNGAQTLVPMPVGGEPVGHRHVLVQVSLVHHPGRTLPPVHRLVTGASMVSPNG